ncbi:4-carboxy-4-hydroxy-2-oxoadipate aldolase/oxaloacetate decarboxylase [Paraburkholderia tropica]|uniref:4-carboxy-4-hydroxy-2-oxoadipate aldolase/oxaloacetate decarboxylase n=1 Tax=Paraburkholderia tropica TaxID=92647 RepID=UPI0007EC8E53|nr:4-carboxy-4-hydroxy-2-oxoadipate aldolase/oxaloacetate decarboxylase [Paraburkholderia tropica]OBR50042.1 4-carboxy-4-hydroxy-2-oxoadipate aldolase/oxaloacetate decarboxylase [Paraburkholderia tropica]
MKNIVIRNIQRAPLEVCFGLAEQGVATVHEAMGRDKLMQPHLRPIFAGAMIAGPAVTVLAAPGDNWMLHVAIEQCHPGDVLVVGVMTENTDGMIGDLISTALKARGVRGVVIDAGCRDVRTLTQMNFPVWSRAVSARGTVKATLGQVNMPVVCGGVLVNPGDIVVADDDGVVVVPKDEANTVLALSRERAAKEEIARARYATGEFSLDASNMRPALAAAGLVYLESSDEL